MAGLIADVNRRKIIFYMFACVACINLLSWFLTQSFFNTTTSHGSDSHSGSSVNTMTKIGDEPAAAFIHLTESARPFRGNHWFHISEHYLSRSRELGRAIFVSNATIVKIIIHSPLVAMFMTEFSFFLLVLSVATQSRGPMLIELFKTVSTVSGGHNYYSGNHTNNTRATLNIEGPIFRYDSADGTFQKLHPAYPPPLMKIANHSGPTSPSVYATGRDPIKASEWFKAKDDVNALRRTIHRICAKFKSASLVYAEVYTAGEAPHPWSSALINDPINKNKDHFWSSQTGLEPNSNSTVSSTYNVERTRLEPHAPKPYSLVFYQRNRNRKILDLKSTLDRVLENFNSKSSTERNYPSINADQWRVTVIYHNELIHPCQLRKMVQDADVFVSAHGFQCTSLIFIKPGATFIELFPYKYFKTSYALLATSMGIRHRYLINTAQSLHPITWTSPMFGVLQLVSLNSCMAEFKCRKFSRKQDVVMEETHHHLLLAEMARIEAIATV